MTVPFGGRRAQGIVTGLTDSAPPSALSQLESLLDPEPVLTAAQIDLAGWIAQTYLAPLIDCLTLMLPPGLAKRADSSTRLNTDVPLSAGRPASRRCMDVLQAARPAARPADRPGAAGDNWRPAAEALVRRGVLAAPERARRRPPCAPSTCAPRAWPPA